jgi:hypothetical protein
MIYRFKLFSVLSNYILVSLVDSETKTTTKEDVIAMAARLSITSKVSLIVILTDFFFLGPFFEDNKLFLWVICQ